MSIEGKHQIVRKLRKAYLVRPYYTKGRHGVDSLQKELKEYNANTRDDNGGNNDGS